MSAFRYQLNKPIIAKFPDHTVKTIQKNKKIKFMTQDFT